MMEFLIAFMVAAGMTAVVVAPLWAPAFWARTFGKARLDEAARVYCEMLSDLVDEDCWSGVGYKRWSHRDSGVVVDLSVSSVTIIAGNDRQRFSEGHPAYIHAKRLASRMKKRAAEAERLAALDGMNKAYKRMGAKH